MKTKFLIVVSALIFFFIISFVPNAAFGKLKHDFRKFYIGSSFEGAMLSIANVQHKIMVAKTTYNPVYGTFYSIHGSSTLVSWTGWYNQPVTAYVPETTNDLSSLRFSLFINTGITFNYNFSRHLGIFSGMDIKNIGYQVHSDTSGAVNIIRRTYNLGVPIGIRVGNMADKKPYVFIGGGLDFPVEFQEKTYVDWNNKNKLNEWSSNRTPSLMPYVFAGFAISRGFSLKFQYYPNNFLNPDFSVNGTKPYASYNVNLMLATIGYMVPLSKRKDAAKQDVETKP